MEQSTTKPKLLILVNNHFDPMWRRCWKRPLEFEGKSFISYNDIETFYLLDNIDLAQQHPEYKFAIECPLVLRTILRDHPEALPILKQLLKEGRFEISGSGETIVDGNMIHGESLVRNFVDGLLWVEDEFGKETRIGLRSDAFGNSAQLPQILKGCDIDLVAGLSYSYPENTYWQGLDGSTILHKIPPVVGNGGGFNKYPPCKTCGGTKKVDGQVCPDCDGRGISSTLRAFMPGRIDEKLIEEAGVGIVRMSPEEMLPSPELIDWAARMGEKYDVQFVVAEDLLPYVQDWIDKADQAEEAELHPGVELNPNNSGVWVSRIKTKQVVRRQEHAMLGLESLLVMAALKGEEYPAETLKQLRHNQYFTMFHDAITATHVDAAYDELLDIMRDIDDGMQLLQKKVVADLVEGNNGYSVINPTGHSFTGTVKVQVPWSGGVVISDDNGKVLPVIACKAQGENTAEVEFMVEDLPAFSAKAIQIEPGDVVESDVTVIQEDNSEGGLLFDFFGMSESKEEELMNVFIENNRFRVDADNHGLVNVYDKQLGKDILVTDEYRPAELILEHDEGSPWATLSPDFTRTSLAKNTHLKRVEKGSAVQQLVFSVSAGYGTGYSGMPLKGEFIVRLVKGMDRVEFSLKTYWSTFNHRLRVAMPVPKIDDEKARYLYEIPYGVLEREAYEPTFNWFGANGDWPAIHWAGIEQNDLSVALFNQGTPSYRMEPGKGNSEVMLLSLLRSPAIPTYLHEPYFYTMTDYDGMRDEGDHEFSFAIGAYGEAFSESAVVLDGESYQKVLPVTPGRVELPQMPKVVSENVHLSAVKWAEKGEGIVLRLVEYRGKAGQVEVALPEGFKTAEQVNLLEKPQASLPVLNGKVKFTVRPWEISTLKLSM